MGTYFAPPVTGQTSRTLASRHPGNRLMRYYPAHDAGTSVYITGGAATTAQPANVSDITRVFYGGHALESVSSSEAAILQAGGFTVIDAATLLASAALWVLPTTVSGSWAGEAWENQGTGGAALDAAFLGTNDDVTFTGTGFRIPVQSGNTSGTADDDGFAVTDDGTLSGSMGEFTCTLSFTPLYDNPETCRFLRKYTGANIIESGAGFVIESARPVGGFIAGGVSEVVNGVAVDGASYIGSVLDVGRRQCVTIRVEDNVLTLVRGRQKIVERTFTGSIADGGALTIGPGQIIHGLAWWTSALSDNEIAAVHAESGSVDF